MSNTENKTLRKGDVPREQRTMQMTMIEQLEHGRMVSNLAYAIGKELQLEQTQLHDLAIAGFLHDIGKTELDIDPDETETAPLVVEEINSIRRHPTKGYEILKRHGYREEICQAVLHHHENYDGSGYPDNLEGWNIPLEACILRVCDVFCSLVSDRPYRSAFSCETAMEMMIEDIQKFDLKVFLAFQRVVHADDTGEIVLPEIASEVRGVWNSL